MRFPRKGQIWVPDCLRIDPDMTPDMTLQTGPQMVLRYLRYDPPDLRYGPQSYGRLK